MEAFFILARDSELVLLSKDVLMKTCLYAFQWPLQPFSPPHQFLSCKDL